MISGCVSNAAYISDPTALAYSALIVGIWFGSMCTASLVNLLSGVENGFTSCMLNLLSIMSMHSP